MPGASGAASTSGGMMTSMLSRMQEKKPVSDEKIATRFRKAQKDTIRKKIRYGPYKLPNPKAGDFTRTA